MTKKIYNTKLEIDKETVPILALITMLTVNACTQYDSESNFKATPRDGCKKTWKCTG